MYIYILYGCECLPTFNRNNGLLDKGQHKLRLTRKYKINHLRFSLQAKFLNIFAYIIIKSLLNMK